ncbi:MAG: hypothetical protein ACJ763_17320 [Bdellovibrionia bacterium]
MRPKLATLTDQLEQSLAAADRLTLNAGSLNLSGNTLGKALGSGRDTLRVLPETLIALKGTLIEASNALSAAGTTAQKTQEGAAGLVLPKKSVQASNIHLQGTSEQLRQLSDVVGELSKSTTTLVRSLDALPTSLNLNFNQAVQGTHTQLQSIQRSLHDASIPTQAMLLGLGLGGLYIFLGFSLILIASMYHQAVVSNATSPAVTPESAAPKRAA